MTSVTNTTPSTPASALATWFMTSRAATGSSGATTLPSRSSPTPSTTATEPQLPTRLSASPAPENDASQTTTTTTTTTTTDSERHSTLSSVTSRAASVRSSESGAQPVSPTLSTAPSAADKIRTILTQRRNSQIPPPVAIVTAVTASSRPSSPFPGTPSERRPSSSLDVVRSASALGFMGVGGGSTVMVAPHHPLAAASSSPSLASSSGRIGAAHHHHRSPSWCDTTTASSKSDPSSDTSSSSFDDESEDADALSTKLHSTLGLAVPDETISLIPTSPTTLLVRSNSRAAVAVSAPTSPVSPAPSAPTPTTATDPDEPPLRASPFSLDLPRDASTTAATPRRKLPFGFARDTGASIDMARSGSPASSSAGHAAASSSAGHAAASSSVRSLRSFLSNRTSIVSMGSGSGGTPRPSMESSFARPSVEGVPPVAAASPASLFAGLRRVGSIRGGVAQTRSMSVRTMGNADEGAPPEAAEPREPNGAVVFMKRLFSASGTLSRPTSPTSVGGASSPLPPVSPPGSPTPGSPLPPELPDAMGVVAEVVMGRRAGTPPAFEVRRAPTPVVAWSGDAAMGAGSLIPTPVVGIPAGAWEAASAGGAATGTATGTAGNAASAWSAKRLMGGLRGAGNSAAGTGKVPPKTMLMAAVLPAEGTLGGSRRPLPPWEDMGPSPESNSPQPTAGASAEEESVPTESTAPYAPPVPTTVTPAPSPQPTLGAAGSHRAPSTPMKKLLPRTAAALGAPSPVPPSPSPTANTATFSCTASQTSTSSTASSSGSSNASAAKAASRFFATVSHTFTQTAVTRMRASPDLFEGTPHAATPAPPPARVPAVDGPAAPSLRVRAFSSDIARSEVPAFEAAAARSRLAGMMARVKTALARKGTATKETAVVAMEDANEALGLRALGRVKSWDGITAGPMSIPEDAKSKRVSRIRSADTISPPPVPSAVPDLPSPSASSDDATSTFPRHSESGPRPFPFTTLMTTRSRASFMSSAPTTTTGWEGGVSLPRTDARPVSYIAASSLARGARTAGHRGADTAGMPSVSDYVLMVEEEQRRARRAAAAADGVSVAPSSSGWSVPPSPTATGEEIRERKAEAAQAAGQALVTSLAAAKGSLPERPVEASNVVQEDAAAAADEKENRTWMALAAAWKSAVKASSPALKRHRKADKPSRWAAPASPLSPSEPAAQPRPSFGSRIATARLSPQPALPVPVAALAVPTTEAVPRPSMGSSSEMSAVSETTVRPPRRGKTHPGSPTATQAVQQDYFSFKPTATTPAAAVLPVTPGAPALHAKPAPRKAPAAWAAWLARLRAQTSGGKSLLMRAGSLSRGAAGVPPPPGPALGPRSSDPATRIRSDFARMPQGAISPSPSMMTVRAVDGTGPRWTSAGRSHTGSFGAVAIEEEDVTALEDVGPMRPVRVAPPPPMVVAPESAPAVTVSVALSPLRPTTPASSASSRATPPPLTGLSMDSLLTSTAGASTSPSSPMQPPTASPVRPTKTEPPALMMLAPVMSEVLVPAAAVAVAVAAETEVGTVGAEKEPSTTTGETRRRKPGRRANREEEGPGLAATGVTYSYLAALESARKASMIYPGPSAIEPYDGHDSPPLSPSSFTTPASTLTRPPRTPSPTPSTATGFSMGGSRSRSASVATRTGGRRRSLVSTSTGAVAKRRGGQGTGRRSIRAKSTTRRAPTAATAAVVVVGGEEVEVVVGGGDGEDEHDGTSIFGLYADSEGGTLGRRGVVAGTGGAGVGANSKRMSGALRPMSSFESRGSWWVPGEGGGVVGVGAASASSPLDEHQQQHQHQQQQQVVGVRVCY
ncbi:hypothetical protein HDU96_001199 [Phlyctochytrium bullatum]|nr:hypothetical protein HDU96_001199 [Phlyctochytrium bullatum]